MNAKEGPVGGAVPAAGPPVTREQLCDALVRLGVAPGDTLFVHSSLKSLGNMHDGPEGVIDALLAAIGPNGHLAMPTHTTYSYVNLHGRGEPYDPATSPSKTGLITDRLRFRTGAQRSGHPTHSVTAVGPEAARFVRGHTAASGTCSIRGPHGRLVRWNGKIVFIGVGLHSNTSYHSVEEWLDLPYMPDGLVRVARPDGGFDTVTVNRPSGHRGFYRKQADGVRDTVTEALDTAGLIRRQTVNQAALTMVRARDCVRVTIQRELESPGALLCQDELCAFCELGRTLCRRQRERIAARGRDLLARPEYCDPAAPPDRSD